MFTSEYPYGIRSEPFLENEIWYLANAFNKILIFPSSRQKYCRKLPVNVEVVDLITNPLLSKFKKILLLLKYINLTTPIILLEIKDKGLTTIVFNLRVALDILSLQLYKFEILKKYIKTSNIKIEIAYDYWFVDSVLALCFLKRKKLIKKIITRSHEFDVFDKTKWGIPYRLYQMKKIDKMYTISKYNKKYLDTKIDSKLAAKITVSYLGVPKNNTISKSRSSSHKVIVTCARLEEYKNVHLIPDVLRLLKTPIKWVLFGNGNMFEAIEKKVQHLPENIQVELFGHIPNVDILNYYKKNHVDLFLCMSSSEGLPVSMMEALSFNIPIVSYAVNGIPEIVIDGVTGFLFYNYNKYDEVAYTIQRALNYSFQKEKMEKVHSDYFDSDNNYNAFALEISSY